MLSLRPHTSQTLLRPRIAAVVGDIARLDVDAVVCPWNPPSLFEQLIRDRIHVAGGQLLIAAAREGAARPDAVRGTFATPSFKLLARHVLHVMPGEPAPRSAANSNNASYMTAGLRSAAQRRAGSVAFLAGPVLTERDIYIARRAVMDVAHWCATNPSPLAVFFCCDTPASAEAYARAIESLGGDSSALTG